MDDYQFFLAGTLNVAKFAVFVGLLFIGEPDLLDAIIARIHP